MLAVTGFAAACAPAPPPATNGSKLSYLTGIPERRLVALPINIPKTWVLHTPTQINRSPIGENEVVSITTFFHSIIDGPEVGYVMLCVETPADASKGICLPEEVAEERQEECMADGSPRSKCVGMSDPVEVDIDPEIPGFTAYFLFKDTAPEIKEFFSKQTLTTEWEDLPWMDREIMGGVH